MGLLDDILGGLAGSALGGQSTAGSNPLGAILSGLASGNQSQSGNLLAAAMSMLQQNGGLANVLEMFRGSGMGQQADSWVGTGANMALSGDQLQQVLGGSAVSNIASQLGMSNGQASSAMAQILPELVNQLTPGGQLPDDSTDILSRGLAMLRGGGV
jgi:uncharacterized protein YidB (DUF937 family)